MARMQLEEYNDIVKKIAGGMSIRAATATEQKRYEFRSMRKKIEAGTLVIPDGRRLVLEKVNIDVTGEETPEAPPAAPLPMPPVKRYYAPVPPEEEAPAPEDVTTEELLKAAKVALYQAMKKASPPPSYINLVFKLCEATLPDWSANKQSRKEGVEEYKSILADLLNDPVKNFEVIDGGKEPERKVSNG